MGERQFGGIAVRHAIALQDLLEILEMTMLAERAHWPNRVQMDPVKLLVGFGFDSVCFT